MITVEQKEISQILKEVKAIEKKLVILVKKEKDTA